MQQPTQRRSGPWMRAVSLVLAVIAIASTARAQLTTQCPASVDSTSLTDVQITDHTEHTYSVRAGARGTFADCTVTRKFAQPIASLKLFIVSGQADDIGYVGSRLVTDVAPACARVSAVTGEVEVTDQVTVDGDTATFTLRAQENCCCVTGWGSATQGDRANARFRWEVSLSAQRVRAGTGAGPDAPGTETVDVSDPVKTAHFPLGSTFFVQLLKKGTGSDPDTPLDATFAIESHNVAPAPEARALFAGRVAFAYDEGSTGTIKYFQAVHQGTATLKITPTDSTQKPLSLPISIDPPSALGSTRPQFDASLVRVAHEWGVPPQILKGQVRKESAFRESAYRYEPLSIDFELFSPNGGNRRTTAPYSDYRLRTSDGLSQGTRLIADDIDPRNLYFIVRNNVRRNIQAGDELVSCREIYEENNARHDWNTPSSQARVNRIRRDPTLLDFTAQTPVAASYGWFQVLYGTAISGGWTGINGQRNPSYLFDTAANLANGGGSVRVAMVRLRAGFIRENGAQGSTPAFATRQQFDAAWQRALNNYNHNFGAEATRPYGVTILGYARDYQPVPAGAIFP
jgi:hypothetical protein